MIEPVGSCGCVPVTLTLYSVSGAAVVTEALVGKQRPSQWLLWCMASLFFLSDVLFFFFVDEKPLNLSLFSIEASI